MRFALLVGASLATAALPRPALAYSPLAYPGSVWAKASRNFDGLEGTGTQGWVRQGVRWARFERVDFDTYAGWSWRFRTQNRTYYDVHGPFVGAAFARGPFTAGAELSRSRYPELPDTKSDTAVFGAWYWSADAFRWMGRPGAVGSLPLALPLTTWGRVDTHPGGLEGTGTMGWVRLGADWFSLRGWTFDTYAMYNWRLRNRNQTYYDAVGPSAGVALQGHSLELGLEYLWQRFPQLGTQSRTFNLYLSLFRGWDLKAAGK